jgi:hypothetical protein
MLENLIVHSRSLLLCAVSGQKRIHWERTAGKAQAMAPKYSAHDSYGEVKVVDLIVNLTKPSIVSRLIQKLQVKTELISGPNLKLKF